MSSSIQEEEKNSTNRGSQQRMPHIGEYLLYSIPIQRQKWGDHQEHPVVNWGDLFFDLFYVAAAYNLANIIRQSPTWEGLLYFVSCFSTVMGMWWDKMYFDARFYTKDDLFHRGFEVCVLVALGTAVLHIRPADTLSRTTENIELFVFSLGIVSGLVLTIFRYVEILVWVQGQSVAKVAARRDIIMKLPGLILSVSAAIVCGRDFYGQTEGTHRRLASGDDDREYSPENDVPIYLILASGLSWLVCVFILMLTLPKDGKHKEVTVPMNVDYSIHRYGEWTMLMLGESILSLLIVEVSGGFDYYTTFFCGILSVIMLQYLHFRSQPQHADGHAMRRTKEAGLAFVFLLQVYSGALLILGTSYKMLLYEYTYANDDYGKGRMLLEFVPRWLAGGDGALRFETEDRRQRISYFFCISLAVVWLCSDLMILAHRGVKNNLGRCKCKRTGTMRKKGLFMVLLRLLLIIAVVVLSAFRTDPLELALLGLAGIATQIALRVFMMALGGDDHVETLQQEGEIAMAEKRSDESEKDVVESDRPEKDVDENDQPEKEDFRDE